MTRSTDEWLISRSCRLWEFGTGKKLDKDRFRHDLGDIEEAYQEVLSRVSK